MAISIGNFTMDGMNGDIQPPKPVFEHFTSLGDTQPYVQRLRSESKESQVSFWKIFIFENDITATIARLEKILGVRSSMTWDGVTVPYDVIVLDYSVSQKKGKSGWLVRIDVTLITADPMASAGYGFGFGGIG